ncbi:MAG: rRNA maturation RNase YbeY [Microthrixaceae bacterium]
MNHDVAPPGADTTASEHAGDPSGPPAGDDPSSKPRVAAGDDRDVADPDTDLDGLADLLAQVLAREGVAAHAEASLTLVDPAAIARLKAEHLDGDGAPTDVLSFPIDGLDGDETSWMVGDVVLCPSVAAAQAAGHAGSVDDELALLVVHGGLHLTGWDHAADGERRAMWNRERELMDELHGPTARDPWTEAT